MSLRQELRGEAFRVLRDRAPEMGLRAARRIVNSPAMQRWFDRVELERPRGIVAWVRRLRGKERGITDEQRAELERVIDRARGAE